MSNIFQPYTRHSSGDIPLNIGVAVPVGFTLSQGLKVDEAGAIYAVLDGTINHYNAGLPFNSDGRLVVSNNPQVRVDQGIPFAASGGMSLGGGIDHYDQSLSYDENSSISTTLILLGAFSSAFSFAFDRVSG